MENLHTYWYLVSIVTITIVTAYSLNKRHYLKQIYRLALNPTKQENLVWEDLKTFYENLGWYHGVYENERFIETNVGISEEKALSFCNSLQGGNLCFNATILTDYPEELTTEAFILATHFNNLMSHGVVTIDVENRVVRYVLAKEIILPCLYTGEISWMHQLHCRTAEDIHWAFQKLVEENEHPALIFADLLTKLENEKNQQSQTATGGMSQ